MSEQQVDQKDLKIQALLERVSNLTAQYENQVADYRVELTVVSTQLEQANAKIAELTEPDAPQATDDSDK
jgi:uncharacterized protein YeeX (DUF496 family)